MSLKAMAFIDGTWLYRSRELLFAKLGETNGCEIDYANLPHLFSTQVAKHAETDVDLVRTHYFGTIPASRPGYAPLKQESFYDFLEKTCGYETDIAEVFGANGFCDAERQYQERTVAGSFERPSWHSV